MTRAVVVTGSRDWSNKETICCWIDRLPKDVVVCDGGAKGADTIAHKIAERGGWDYAFPSITMSTVRGLQLGRVGTSACWSELNRSACSPSRRSWTAVPSPVALSLRHGELRPDGAPHGDTGYNLSERKQTVSYSRFLKANLPGHCPICRGPIDVGEEIQKSTFGGWAHVDCPEPPDHFDDDANMNDVFHYIGDK